MNNYRVEYGTNVEVDYWNKKLQPESGTNFRNIPAVFYPELSQIYAEAEKLGIKHAWHFYEPYVEFTWLSDDAEASEKLIEFIKVVTAKYKDLLIRRPADGVFADWYCTSEREREFGAKRHALCAEWVKLYNEYKDAVDNGKGLSLQVARTIHTLANPLGINYKDEARICLARFFACTMFRYLPFKLARFIYTRLLRFKY